ncbi:MAG: hypothetical protein GXO17_02120, partial [Thermodesulfobacteria bacterium]|nr:hypothetical protein [Thermodesulfobacteriota bacterium]
EVLEEKLEEWKKTYKGKVTAVKVLKEEPDHIVLEVSFEDVKRPEETYVTGEVLFGGVPASNFVVDRIPLTEKRGSLRLNVYYVEPETYEMEAGRSDQIVVYLYPAGAPEKRFGEYYLALVRTWGSSSEEEAGITLTDESSPTNEEAKPSPVIPEGSFPYPKLSPVFFTKTYDFYDKAELAQWRSSYGTLPFSGNPNDRRGFVRKISAGHLSTGNNARKLLETRPPRERRGWIEGEYPALVLAKGVHFQAAAGFLKGAQASDGAIFKLYVKDSQGHRHRVLAQYVRPGRYVHLDADLSRFAGQKVALILHVSAWRTPTQDWAVWVAPRLTIP